MSMAMGGMPMGGMYMGGIGMVPPPPPPNNNKLILVLILLVLVGGAFYYWNTISSSTSPPTTSPVTVTQEPTDAPSLPTTTPPATAFTGSWYTWGQDTAQWLKLNADGTGTLTKLFEENAVPRARQVLNIKWNTTGIRPEHLENTTIRWSLVNNMLTLYDNQRQDIFENCPLCTPPPPPP